MVEQKGCAIVIVGASGDLAKRKLIPALAALYAQGKIGSEPLILGTGRSNFTDEEFRNIFAVDGPFRERLFYHPNIAGIHEYCACAGYTGRVIFFLSLPPKAYASTAAEIAAEGFGERASIIIEKPFGHDVATAHRLNSDIATYFTEQQIFRIDHYLAKEAVQNILVFRFANSLFYPVWNSRNIESIQISALETDGVGDRAAYFDTSGIIRDMVQNHLLQLLCLLTMEAPLTLDPEDIRCQKVQVLRALRIDECYRAHYEGYRNERGIDPSSDTETYAEMRLSINNIRWAGVPVFIRTGKKMNRKGTEIGIRFKPLPKLLFNTGGDLPPNQIVFKIQPAEGIIVDIQSKIPGTDSSIVRSKMNFCYNTSFGNAIPEAYQRLIYDVIRNDHTLFVSAQESETAWSVVEPVLGKGPLASYTPGNIPAGYSGCDWIAFDEYKALCS